MNYKCHILFVPTVCACLCLQAQDQRADGTPSKFFPQAEQLKSLEANPDDHPVIVLKLLKYTGPEGRKSYERYSEIAVQCLRKLGGEVVFFGKAKPFEIDFRGSPKLFGLRSTPWDAVVFERYRSRKDLRKLGESEDYRAATIHLGDRLSDSVMHALNGSPISGDKRSMADTEVVPDPPGPDAVYMLNLLKFKPGRENDYFEKYGTAVTPLITKHGGKVIFGLRGEQLLVGKESYDRVFLVMYPSVTEFTKMIVSEEYQKISHHRADGLEVGHLFGFANAAPELKRLGDRK